ncbi:MAG: hypothetical protein HY337_06310 [Gemmatimonadetes bacterium]|nr:hypothetical protein [Gemmatimonadota bacterium]
MLTNPQVFDGAPAAQSLKQEYDEFILQRIEEYKDQLRRAELLAIADEAVRELESGSDDQLVLTEVLVLEHVDRLIMRRLNLPTYRRWRERHVRLRRAQQEPTHWGLDPDTPLSRFAGPTPADAVALVVGGGAASAALYLASHGRSVLFIDSELAAVEGAEARAAGEALAARFQALVVDLGTWIPDVQPWLAVLDPATLTTLEGQQRHDVIAELKRRTCAGGSHLILPSNPPEGVTPLAPEAMQTYYSDWQLERPRRRGGAAGRGRWFLATRP